VSEGLGIEPTGDIYGLSVELPNVVDLTIGLTWHEQQAILGAAR